MVKKKLTKVGKPGTKFVRLETPGGIRKIPILEYRRKFLKIYGEPKHSSIGVFRKKRK